MRRAVGEFCQLFVEIMWRSTGSQRRKQLTEQAMAFITTLLNSGNPDWQKVGQRSKEHLLIHLAENEERFGPIYLMQTDRSGHCAPRDPGKPRPVAYPSATARSFMMACRHEAFNSIRRDFAHFHSNMRNRSRDMATRWAALEILRLLAAGGSYLDDNGQRQWPGRRTVEILNEPEVRSSTPARARRAVSTKAS